MDLARIIRQWAIPAFAATMLIPLYWWRDWYASDSYQAAAALFKYAALAVMGILCAASWKFVRRVPVLPSAFLLWAGLSVLWSVDPPESAGAAVALGVYLLAILGLLGSGDHVKGFRYTAWVIAIGLAVLAVLLGTWGRQIGGITANTLGHYAFAVLVLLCLKGPVRWWWWVFVLGIMLFAQSRTLLIATGVFVAFRYGVMPITSALLHKVRSAGAAFIPFAVGGIALGAGWLAGEAVFRLVREFSIFVGVTEKLRLDHTLTGRTDLWRKGADLFERAPWGGLGFSTRTSTEAGGAALSAHSGFINLLIDLGLIGALLFAVWYVTALWRSIIGIPGKHPKVSITCAAALFAMVPVLTAEPNYIGFYDPTSLAFLVCLTLPFATRIPRRPLVPLEQGRPAPAFLHAESAPTLR